MDVRLEVDCQTAMTSLQVPMKFNLQAKSPPGIAATGPAQLEVDPTDCSNGAPTVIGTATYQVLADRNATPEQPVFVSVMAHGQAIGPTNTPTALAMKSNIMRVRLLMDIEALTPQPEGRAGPQKPISFPIEVKNHSNGRVLVTFEIVSADPRWRAIEPAPLVLDSLGGQSADTTHFVVNTPFENGPNDNEATFVVRARTVSALNQSHVGPVVDLTFHAQSDGLYVPGPGLPGAGLAIAAAALARRGRRDPE